MKRSDGRDTARENELSVLRALHRFGWLRTRDIAALVWQRWASKPQGDQPSFAPPAMTQSALRMAQRTLKRMRATGLVLSGSGPDGAVLYALAERGAARLRDVGVEASTGKDLIRSFSVGHYHHRCVANECAISAIQEGYRASPEREIAQGRWFAGSAGVAGKCPDALVRAGSKHWWVEVERSRKNAKDYAHLLKWMSAAIPEVAQLRTSGLLGEGRQLARIVFICRPSFKARLTNDLLSRGVSQAHIDFSIRWETCLYRLEAIAFF